MPIKLEPVRPIELADVREARKRIAGTIVRTPLVRLELGELELQAQIAASAWLSAMDAGRMRISPHWCRSVAAQR